MMSVNKGISIQFSKDCYLKMLYFLQILDNVWSLFFESTLLIKWTAVFRCPFYSKIRKVAEIPLKRILGTLEQIRFRKVKNMYECSSA